MPASLMRWRMLLSNCIEGHLFAVRYPRHHAGKILPQVSHACRFHSFTALFHGGLPESIPLARVNLLRSQPKWQAQAF